MTNREKHNREERWEIGEEEFYSTAGLLWKNGPKKGFVNC